ncbi:hypothetical protein ABE521_20885 [Pseudomonas sp. TWI672]|uniref:hypothetical protein n=1 Tax=unclassified Pseudomonas TaxID=196821 RepID=UPI00320B77A8
MKQYEELDSMYSQYTAKANAQDMVLKKFVNALAAGLPAYLGLPENAWYRADGRKGGARVRLGLGKPESFDEKTWLEIPTFTDGSVNFSVAYSLVSGGDENPYHIVFELKVECYPEFFVVQLKHHEQDLHVSADQEDKNRFNDVYSAMVEGIKRVSDPARIKIPGAKL